MSADAPLQIYKPYLIIPQFTALEPPEARAEVENYLINLNEVWEERDRQLVSALQGLILGIGMAVDDLSDVVITAANLDDFIKFDGTNWVDFPLFSTANSWTATQAFEHIVPSADDTWDIGAAGLSFRAIFLDNSGGRSIVYPDAVGTGADTDYTIHVGGGADVGSGATEGGRFTLNFSPCQTLEQGFNELIINLDRSGNTAGFINRLTVRSILEISAVDITGLFRVQPGVPPAPTVDFNFVTDPPGALLGTGIMRFTNQEGNIEFQPASTTSITQGFVINPTGGSAASQVPFIYRNNDTAAVGGTQGVSAAHCRPNCHSDFLTAAGDKHAWGFGKTLSSAATILSFFQIRPESRLINTGQPYHHLLVFPFPRTGIPQVVYLPGDKNTGAASVSANNIITTAAFAEPNINLNGFLLRHAATVYIQDAPTEGGTNNHALWVDSGTTRLDAAILLGTTATSDVNTGVSLSAATGVLTLLGLGTAPENLTIDLNTSNIVTLASTTGVTDLVLSFANIRTTTALEIDGTLNHDGASISFFGGAAGGQGAAYTQTAYATADRTHAALTSAVLVDSTTGGAPNQDVAVVDATGANLTTNATINDNFRELLTQTNALRVDIEDVKQLVNAVIDDLQSWGMVA